MYFLAMETIGKVSVTGLLNTGRDQIESIYGLIYIKLLKHSNHYNVKIIYYYYFSLLSIPLFPLLVFLSTCSSYPILNLGHVP